jgi:CRISPR system Cascade subunit CasA
MVVTGFRMLPRGVSYVAFEHPLSPYYRAKPNSPDFLPIHPQPGGIPYRDWPSLVGEPPDQMRRPAAIVTGALARLDNLDEPPEGEPRLLASGFDMDNMKARGFVETEMPLFVVKPEDRGAFDTIARGFAMAADMTANAVARAVRDALAGDKADAGTTPFVVVRETFFECTERGFYQVLATLEKSMRAAVEELVVIQAKSGNDWLKHLRRVALGLFDDNVQPEDRPEHEIERAILGRKTLLWLFAGVSKDGRDLYARLGLAAPEISKKRARAVA